MSTKIPYVITGSGKVTAIIDGQDYVFNKDHINYKQLKNAVVDGDTSTFLENFNIQEAISNFTDGEVELTSDGTILYNGKEVRNSLTQRIADIFRQDLTITPWINFLKKLMSNPSKHSIDQLYTFLEHKDLPLTSEGDFLAYKRVRDTGKTDDQGRKIFVDCHSGSIKQWVGKVVEIPRNEVDDDYRNECSYGLHVGSIKYVASFSPGDVIVMVKVNPADVVSVPSYDCTKCRTCRYEIIGMYNGVIDQAVMDMEDDYWAKDEDEDDYEDYDDYDS